MNSEFERTFHIAYRAYIRGDWHTAGTHLKNLIISFPDDGPVRNLHRWVVK